ncbi:hypothetical protein MKK75_07620 [Methylobacterium sp. J-030]|uniref:hypothetical protein n=1 Tax=Methylobacterium sp. J-030 TaxID=2836627 RepID=UPI001FB974EB|nr:hypothetical protein [Methylobacterium sp. J-030]MCJ2068670.1 hypothetical protein [Methylobacterium sp. J-030]
MALACLAIGLGGCASSSIEPPAIDPAAPADIRVTLPAPPDGVEACVRASFPDIPDRSLTRADVVRIIGRAKVLDRQKRRCSERAQAWIDAVQRDFAKP